MNKLMKFWWGGVVLCMTAVGICIYISATKPNYSLIVVSVLLFGTGLFLIIKMMFDNHYHNSLFDGNEQPSRHGVEHE